MLHTALLHSHSGLRWLILAVLFYGITQAWLAWKKGASYQSKNRRFHLIGMTLTHIQLLIGLVLYGLAWGTKVDFARMDVAAVRFFTVEHSSLMLLAIALISIGYSRAKRASTERASWKSIWLFWGIGLVLILLAIPWPVRHALGAGWF